MLRDGLHFDDIGYSLSWADVRDYIKYSPSGSALAFVNANPPTDPATIPTPADLRGVSERIAAARALAANQDTTPVRTGHHVEKPQ